MSLRSARGLTQDATASQKKMKSCTTPLGLTPIMAQMPRNAESFSSLSRMFRSDVHLEQGGSTCTTDHATSTITTHLSHLPWHGIDIACLLSPYSDTSASLNADYTAPAIYTKYFQTTTLQASIKFKHWTARNLTMNLITCKRLLYSTLDATELHTKRHFKKIIKKHMQTQD